MKIREKEDEETIICMQGKMKGKGKEKGIKHSFIHPHLVKERKRERALGHKEYTSKQAREHTNKIGQQEARVKIKQWKSRQQDDCAGNRLHV